MDTGVKQRTNDDWLMELAEDSQVRAAAIRDLRLILLNGLRRALLNQVDATGSDFEALIDDFAQDALLKTLEKLDSFEGRSRFTTWAHKIAIHVALSELRRKRWRDRSLDDMMETEDGDYTPRFVADSAPGPDVTAEQADMIARVRRLIREELTDKQRTVMIATAIEGATPADVARQLNMKTNAVYKVLHDARVRLRQRLTLEGLSTQEILAIFESD